MTPPIEIDPDLILPTRLRPLPSRTDPQVALAALPKQNPRPKRQGQPIARAKATARGATNARRRRGRPPLSRTRRFSTPESSSSAPTPTSRRTRTPPTSPTDSDEAGNSSSLTAIPPNNIDSATRVATLPHTTNFQHPFQRLRLLTAQNDIIQLTSQQAHISYSNQYPLQQPPLLSLPSPPSPSYAFTPTPSRISSTSRQPSHVPDHLPYMNIDLQANTHDTIPQPPFLPQRRLDTISHTPTCVASDSLQLVTPQRPEQHQHTQPTSTPTAPLISSSSVIVPLTDHDIVSTPTRPTNVPTSRIIDTPEQPTTTVNTENVSTQTDPLPFCLYCQWHEQTWLPRDTEHRWRTAIRREIWVLLKEQPPFIRSWCGNWAAATTECIYRSIPLMLTTPFMSLFYACNNLDPLCNPRLHSLPRSVIPVVILTHTTLVYVIRVAFACGVLTPLFSYTTQQRWPYIIPPLIDRFQHSLTTIVHQLPSLYLECEQQNPHQVIASIIAYLTRVIQHECNHLDAHYQQAYSLRSHFVD